MVCEINFSAHHFSYVIWIFHNIQFAHCFLFIIKTRGQFEYSIITFPSVYVITTKHGIKYAHNIMCGWYVIQIFSTDIPVWQLCLLTNWPTIQICCGGAQQRKSIWHFWETHNNIFVTFVMTLPLLSQVWQVSFLTVRLKEIFMKKCNTFSPHNLLVLVFVLLVLV
jgi:hypothetical protein